MFVRDRLNSQHEEQILCISDRNQREKTVLEPELKEKRLGTATPTQISISYTTDVKRDEFWHIEIDTAGWNGRIGAKSRLSSFGHGTTM